jgi:alpha-tubulin suppressor-like RCC1 family protein
MKLQQQIQQTQEVVIGGYTEFFSWGNDSSGQLGHGNERSDKIRKLNLPKSLSFEVQIKNISCGSNFAAFLT